jgi:hypothetical protein
MELAVQPDKVGIMAARRSMISHSYLYQLLYSPVPDERGYGVHCVKVSASISTL